MTNASIEIRVPLGQGELLLDTVYREGMHEYVAFGLVSHAWLKGHITLLVRHVIPLHENQYLSTFQHGAAWRGVAMVPIIGQAVDEGLGIVLFHAHFHNGPPKLSRDDIASAERLIPMFRQRVPTRAHGSVVLSRTHASGIVYPPGESQPRATITMRWYGEAIQNWISGSDPTPSTDPNPIFNSQALVVGGPGQTALHNAKVAVVGLSGGGSHVVQQLAHLGIGLLIMIDPDRVEARHRHRIVGLTWLDTLFKRRKVDVMARLVERLGTGSRCIKLFAKVPEPTAVEALKSADIIVGCLDNLHARADLQEIASRFLIPYVDVGVNIRQTVAEEKRDPRVSIGGNVITFTPGGFCMWCCGFLSKDKLAAELNGPNRSYFQNKTGEAQVVSLNGIVASQAVTEVLQLLTGFGGSGIRQQDVGLYGEHGIQRGFRKLDGVKGNLTDWGAKQYLGCIHCGQTLARGDVAWCSPR
jgi:ThiF family